MTPDQPTGMNELREIVANIEDWHGFREQAIANLPEDVREFVDDTSWAGEMLRAERLRLAEAAVQQLVERCLGPDEPTTQSLLDDGLPYIDNPVAVRRNELRAEIRHNLQQAGLLRGDELTQKPAKETEGQ